MPIRQYTAQEYLQDQEQVMEQQLQVLTKEGNRAIMLLKLLELTIADAIRDVLKRTGNARHEYFALPQHRDVIVSYFVQRLIDVKGNELRELLPILSEKWEDRVEEMVESTLLNLALEFLSGKRVRATMDDANRILRRLHDFEQSQKTESRQRIIDAVVRDMTKEDLPDFERMYEMFRITPEEAMLVINQQYEKFYKRAKGGMFIKPCKQYELRKLEQYLDVTESLKGFRGRERFSHETVVAKVMVDAITGEKLSFVVLTDPPIDPIHEPNSNHIAEGETYMEEQEKLFIEGISGGGMRFIDEHQQASLWSEIQQGAVGMIWMIIRLAPGAVHRTAKEAIAEYASLRPRQGHTLKSYRLENLIIRINGEPLKKQPATMGTNTGSASFLQTLGQSLYAIDCNNTPDAPGVDFEFQNSMKVSMKPGWSHTSGSIEAALQGADASYEKFLQ